MIDQYEQLLNKWLLFEYQLELYLQQLRQQYRLVQDHELLFFEFVLVDFVEQL
jgi:hypothetical protein